MKLDYNKNALDAFRLIATIQVFLGHIISHFHMDSATVTVVYFIRGVPILFVLCGFLAAKSLEGHSAKSWLIGRAARILPGFWTCIVINTIIILLVYETKPTVLQGGVYAVTQFLGLNFYTGDWLRGYGSGVPNGVLWTIPVQIQFFLLAPLFHKYFKKASLRQAGRAIAAFTLSSILLQQCSEWLPEIISKLINVTVFPYLYFLIAGMVGWYHRDTIIPFFQRKKWIVLGCYVVWKLMENLFNFPHVLDGALYNTVTTLLLAAVIFAFAFTGSWRMKKDLTFGFYLYHMVFINLLLHLGYASLNSLCQGILQIAGVAAAATVCAWLSARFVEEPAAKIVKQKY